MDERAEMLAILGPAIDRLKEYEAARRVVEPFEVSVVDGIGFAWPTLLGFQIVIHCIGPITEDGALIRIGAASSSGELTWITPTPLFLGETEINPDCRYPAPRETDRAGAVFLTDRKILDLIAKLVGDPVSE
jgi:hypothetical protein